VGTSWGGLHALTVLVRGLPADFALPLAVVQHRSKDSDGLLAQILQDETELRVSEVEDKEPIEAGHVYVAPPDYHLLVDGAYFSLSVDPPVRFSRPSIDVTFISAASACGAATVGVVLTGANEDGALGLRRIAERGGHAVVQDPASAEIATMPAAARRAVPSATVLRLEEMSQYLTELAASACQARARHAAPGELGRRA
jgi:two-component system, chemotaxis family, protein-glutamate methylesterase/glutaminase